jgi:hypothetical protein
MGLHSSSTSQCVFTGTIIEGAAPIHLGLYVDDLVYFSPDPAVELEFERLLAQHFPVSFMGVATHFLGLHLQWNDQPDNNLSVHLSQTAYIDDLLHKHGLHEANPVLTPYRSGTHIDTAVGESSDDITHQYLSIVGSLGWLVNIVVNTYFTIQARLRIY